MDLYYPKLLVISDKIMPRPRFWPSENMRVAAFSAMKKRGLKGTLETKKAFRYHYQRMADMGLFKSPTSEELARIGIDTTSWNEGIGTIPNDIEKKIERAMKRKSKIKPVEKNVSPQQPEMKGTTMRKEDLKKIINAGPRFSKDKEEKEERPYWTGRIWKGEHYDWDTGKWELKEGHWWDPETAQWVPGEPRLNLFYWAYEFYYDPRKYAEPVPFGEFHKELAKAMEDAYRDVFLCPRDHLKTTWSAIFMLWRILEYAGLAKMGILNIAWDPGLAETTFLDVKGNLEDNERILSFYGYVIDENRPITKELFYFVYQPTGAKFGLRCTSFKSGSITGSHPYWVLLDDPQDEPLTKSMMAKFKRVINKKLIPAVGKSGIIMVTGTIKGYSSENDGYLWLEKKPLWRVQRWEAANAMPEMSECIYEKRLRPKKHPITGEILKDYNGNTDYEEYWHVEVEDRERFITLYPERYQIEDLVAKRLEMREDDTKSDDDFWSEYFLRASDPKGKYFLKNRIGDLPPEEFFDTQSFVEWLHTFHYAIFLWIDPGGQGKKSHGVAITVGTYVLGRYYLLDCLVVKAGLPQVAEAVARLIVKWGVSQWGCEGNFDQKETYGNTIDTFLKAYMQKQGWSHLYRRPLIRNNTGNKLQRIATHISDIIGLEGTDITFFVNPGAQHLDKWKLQLGHFGKDISGEMEHEFDLLDSYASMKIHMFSHARKAVCVAV